MKRKATDVLADVFIYVFMAVRFQSAVTVR